MKQPEAEETPIETTETHRNCHFFGHSTPGIPIAPISGNRTAARCLFLASVLLCSPLLVLAGTPGMAKEVTRSPKHSATTATLDVFEAEAFLAAGKYQEAMALADVALQSKDYVSQRWAIVKMKSALATGKYAAALQTYLDRKETYRTHVEFRAAAIPVLRFNDRDDDANRLLREIEKLWQDESWRYTDASELVAIGRVRLELGGDAKSVLSRFYDRARDREPNSPLPYQATAELALSKDDFTLAIKNYRLALQRNEDLADTWLGLAKSLWASDRQQARQAMSKALELNPRHIATLNFHVDSLINAEEYLAAEEKIKNILAINPHDPEAWAYRSVIAQLTNQPRKEGDARTSALRHWKRNPKVDHLIGKKLSQKYRFLESIRYQRRSLVYSPGYLPAKIQLAHDLLRTGQELEGWKLADEVFDEDQYSVVAYNLVRLRKELSGFETIETDGFVIRMSQREAAIYGDDVQQLLTSAKKHLVERYQVELESPIFVEIFPQQQDFAIRTFGLPGGEGFLGVCFGRLITMNSPAAQGPKPTNWRSVLWHEFCHVVTLQKTKNRMPRWLSEGISVYEEGQKNPAWGQSMNLRYRSMMVAENVKSISQLSSAFLTAASPEEVDFAYYLSSVAVEFLIEEYGFEKLLQILDQLGAGIPINDALRRIAEPLPVLDKKFLAHIEKRVAEYSPEVAWDQDGDDQFKREVQQIKQLLQQEKYQQAIEAAESLQKLFTDRETTALCLDLKANCLEKLERPDQQLKTLQELISFDASHVDATLRGLTVASELQNTELEKFFADHLIGLNPLDKSPHRVLARLAVESKDTQRAIRHLQALLELDPIDKAKTNFQLAEAFHQFGKRADARRHVLLSLRRSSALSRCPGTIASNPHSCQRLNTKFRRTSPAGHPAGIEFGAGDSDEADPKLESDRQRSNTTDKGTRS